GPGGRWLSARHVLLRTVARLLLPEPTGRRSAAEPPLHALVPRSCDRHHRAERLPRPGGLLPEPERARHAQRERPAAGAPTAERPSAPPAPPAGTPLP